MLIMIGGIDDDAEDKEPNKPMLPAKAVSSLIHKIDKLAEMDVNIDLLMVRSFKFKRRLADLMAHEEVFGRLSYEKRTVKNC